MKGATKVMYFIGRIFNWIELFGGLITAIVGTVLLILAITNGSDPAAIAAASAVLVPGAIIFLIALVVIILAKRASKSLNEPNPPAGPHILMLIIGIISQNYFFILGAIFGLIARGNR